MGTNPRDTGRLRLATGGLPVPALGAQRPQGRFSLPDKAFQTPLSDHEVQPVEPADAELDLIGFLSFAPELGDPGLVHLDTHGRSVYYERPEELATYRKALRRLHAQALPPQDTSAVVEEIMEEL